jgi:dihydroorotase
MPDIFDLILRGGICVTPNGTAPADVGVRHGRIAAIGHLAPEHSARTIDVGGLHVLPGVIDSQVHFREPGNTHKEDLETGGRAAVLGGVTAVFEMPNTNPPTTTAGSLSDKLARAKGRMACDYAFYAGASPDNIEELAALERVPGCAGIKMFMGSSTGTLLVPDDATVLRVLRAGSRRVAVHAEDEARLLDRRDQRIPGDPASHPVWRDAQTALLATRRLMELARAAGRRVHVLHVTTDAEIGLLAQNRDLATVEVTPQHLTLRAPECYERLGTLAQMNPPIRDAAHQAGLWAGIRGGIVDVLGSDHAPHTREEKAKAYPDSPSGMPGVQTLVPIMLDHVAAGRLTLERFVDLTAAGPARIFGLAGKGRIAIGYDADFTLVDLKERRRIENKWIASRCGWTPFDGVTVTGWPKGTIIRGHIAMWEDALQGQPQGAPLRFHEAPG